MIPSSCHTYLKEIWFARRCMVCHMCDDIKQISAFNTVSFAFPNKCELLRPIH